MEINTSTSLDFIVGSNSSNLFQLQEARKNLNSFSSREEEEKYLIYNYVPTYTGAIGLDQSMIQCYFF